MVGCDAIPDKRCLLQHLLLKQERNSLEREVAVVGVAGLFPGASTVAQFWDLLVAGECRISEVPSDRWDWTTCYDPDPARAADGKLYCRWGGFLEGIRKFDCDFFRIAPREAAWMDPQERLFLQVAWQAFEDAGMLSIQAEAKRTGVFVGATTVGYPWLLHEARESGSQWQPTASFASLANRVSHYFNLQGPSLPVDTQCSSALTAFVLACESIQNGQCDSALVGGVNLYPHISKYRSLCQMGLVSQDGTTRSFGKGGRGFVPGECVGAVVLKPLRQALIDGDRIYATVLGGAVMHTGRSSSFLSPNPAAQTALIRRVLDQAGVPASSIQHVEAQGLGSESVDLVEWTALVRAYQESTPDLQFCSLGTLKPNIGHAESASGIAQLIKVLLQLKFQRRCPTLLRHPLNAEICPERSPFYFNQALGHWPVRFPEGPLRRAAVSAHGAGGTSAHVILEEFPWADRIISEADEPPRRHFFPIAARSPEALRQWILQLHGHLTRLDLKAGEERVYLRNMAFTLQHRRPPLPSRQALWAGSIQEITAALDRAASGALPSVQPGVSVRESRIANDWMQEGKLAASDHVAAETASAVWLPPYCFEPRELWIAPTGGVGSEQGSGNASRSWEGSVRQGLRTPFFQSMRGYYQTVILVHFQLADWFVNPKVGHAPAGVPGISDKSKDWLCWLLEWMASAGWVASDPDGLWRLTSKGDSQEIRGRIVGLKARRELILRAVPELEPWLQCADHAGSRLVELLLAKARVTTNGAPAGMAEGDPDILMAEHRFTRELAQQMIAFIERCPDFSTRNKRSVRIHQRGRGSLVCFRYLLQFLSQRGLAVEWVRCSSAADCLPPFVARMLHSEFPNVRLLESAAVSASEGSEVVQLIYEHCFKPWRQGQDQGQGLTLPERHAVHLQTDTGDAEFLAVVFGHSDPSWLCALTAPDTVHLPQSTGEDGEEDSAEAGADLESVVRRCIADALGVPESRVLPNLSFADMSVSSLLLAQAHANLRTRLGNWVLPQWMVLESSVRDLAAVLAASRPDGSGFGRTPIPPTAPTLKTLDSGLDNGRTAPGARYLLSPSGAVTEYFEDGNPDGEPVVVLTALAFTRDIWQHQLTDLGRRFRLIFPHLPGHGGSRMAPSGFSFESLSEDLLALLDALAVDRVHLVGWCMAGNLAQVLALKHRTRLRSLSLICTTPTDARTRGLSSEDLQIYSQMPLATYEAEFDNLMADGSMNSAQRAVWLEAVHSSACAVDPGATLCYLDQLFRFDTRSRLGTLDVPTWVVAGKRDIAFPPDQVRLLHEGIPGSKYTLMNKSGHMPFLTQPDLFNYLLEDFLSAH